MDISAGDRDDTCQHTASREVNGTRIGSSIRGKLVLIRDTGFISDVLHRMEDFSCDDN